MMLQRVTLLVRRTNSVVLKNLQRNYGVTSVLMCKPIPGGQSPGSGSMSPRSSSSTPGGPAVPQLPPFNPGEDPIQKLFVEKIKEYATKSKAIGGKMVDATPQIEKELTDDLEKLLRQYGGGKGIDLGQFPTFKYKEPTLDPINMEKK